MLAFCGPVKGTGVILTAPDMNLNTGEAIAMEIKLIASGSRPWEKWFGYWGLSFLIDGTILYDTFANDRVLMRKLRAAKVDPLAIKTVVLSHDHWDHTGGLWAFLKQYPGIDVYLPRTVHESVKRRVIESGGKLIDASGATALQENVLLSDEMIGAFQGKPIAEQFLLIKTEKGLVILVGCSHPGILSIVQMTKKTFGAPVYGIAGGFHLMHAATEEIYACANALKNEGIQKIAPTHCTGLKAEAIFKKVFGKGFMPVREGQNLFF